MLPPRALRVLRDLSRIRTSASALNSISHVIQLPQPATWMSVLGMSSMAATTAPAGTKAIAVVGGGISGLHCAHVLSQRGFTVTVFDLGKHSPGGRLTTRRTTLGGLQFDHGCQFVRPVSAAFRSVCDEWVAAGALVPWSGAVCHYDALSGKVTPREQWQAEQQAASSGESDNDTSFLGVMSGGPLFVGHPSSDAVTAHVAAASRASIRNDVRVSRAAWDSSTRKWLLEGMLRFPTRTQTDAKQQPPHKPWNLGVFDGLVLADKMTGCTGTPGFVELSGTPAGAKLQAAMAQVGSKPLLVLMAAWQPPELPLEEQIEGDAAEQQAGGGGVEAARRSPPVVPLPFDAAAVSGSDEIQWISLDSTKPGRGRADGMQTLVAVSTTAFAEQLISRNADGSLPPQTPELLAGLVPPMFAALRRALAPLLADSEGQLQEPAFVQVHRWGSALPAAPFGSPCLTADTASLAACGDFCLGDGVEGAVLSADAAAQALTSVLGDS